MSYDSAQLKALVADMSPHMADLVAQMLHGLGIRNVTPVHTEAALRSALAQTAFDVVLLDAELGSGTSVALVADLRRTPAHRNHGTPVIMMASEPNAPLIAAARDAGVNEFLRKPFSAQHIKLRLDAIYNSSRAFVDTEAYAGPDRRRKSRPVQSDRRSGT
jgi:DNA-binding response OmpR family regulator